MQVTVILIVVGALGTDHSGQEGGARGVMVIVVQILDETDCISHCTNTLGKCMNPIILPPTIGK